MNPIVIPVVIVVAVLALLLLLSVRVIPNNRIGIVEKRFSSKGSVTSGFIALNGEAGFQPNVLRGGWHFLIPFQYVVHMAPLVTIPQGKIGYVFARDGAVLGASQSLASNRLGSDFTDVVGFLKNGGQRGPQRQILREGTYALNLAQFIVITQERVFYLPLNRDEQAMIVNMAQVIGERGGFTPVIIRDADDSIGIVTVHDGPSLPQGEIIALTVGEDTSKTETYHNNFQDADKFLAAGGLRGRQLQVIVEGTYYINRLFATVEMVKKTFVDVGNVGVIIFFTGATGADLSGVDYKHGEMVRRGERGVWNEAMLPGKYALNTYAARLISVPTTNFILKWTRGESGAHKLDENLSEVSLITKDAFEPQLPLSVVVHIDYKKAPMVIQRFGDIKRLVEQTLDPMVAAYFKNIGQTRTLIQLIQERSQIQLQASQEMKEKFARYNLELEEVLIGTPSAPKGDTTIETILTQLRQRQIANEQVETYARQEKSAFQERMLREAQARAAQQTKITESELNIMVQGNQGKADYQRAVQQAAQIRTLAEAEAEKAARIGIGQALAIDEQVRAYGGPQYQVTQQVMNRFAEAIEAAKVDVVPRISITNGGGQSGGMSGGGNGLIEGLLAMLLSERMGGVLNAPETPRSPEAEALRQQILSSLAADAKKDAPSQ